VWLKILGDGLQFVMQHLLTQTFETIFALPKGNNNTRGAYERNKRQQLW
jgi:hypothetical protein